MKKTEAQALVLDRLMEVLEHGNKGEVNLLSELTGEIEFKDLRAAVYYLATMGFIDHNEDIPDNQGFYCKINKEGIKHHQEIFEPLKEAEKSKTMLERLKDIKDFLEGAKTIAVVLFVVITMVFGISVKKLIHLFPPVANLLGIEVQNELKNDQIPSKNNENLYNNNLKKPLQKKLIPQK